VPGIVEPSGSHTGLAEQNPPVLVVCSRVRRSPGRLREHPTALLPQGCRSLVDGGPILIRARHLKIDQLPGDPGRSRAGEEAGVGRGGLGGGAFFQLVSSRYERASLIVTSNKPFGRWGEVFGDDIVAAAMIDRLVHHADVVALKGDSYRLRNRDLGRVPTAATDES
jgi:hypothetical protein